MLKPVRRLMGAGTSLVLTALLIAAARFIPDLWFSFYPGLSRKAMAAIAGVTGKVPVCLWELVAVSLVIAGLVLLFVSLHKRHFLNWLTGCLELICLLVFLFVALWGLNHYGPPLSEQLDMQVGTYSQEELRQAAAYYAQMAGLCSAQVDRNEAGDLVFPDFDRQAELAVESYELLGASNDRFVPTAPTVKPLLFSKAFGYMGTTGVYLCLTGEASVSRETFIAAQPYTMCHELAHSLAFAGEDEANFCAFLACEASASPVLRYSGYYNAFVYCYNALSKVNRDSAQAIWDSCPETLVHDCRAHAAFDRQYEGKVQEAAQKVNDTYLKAFDEPGVQSYGFVTDYLIAHYLELQHGTGR